MRRLIVLILMSAAGGATVLALGAGAGAQAPPSPLSGLDRTFRALVPDARCAEAAPRVRAARRQRAAALRGARDATPRVLVAKKAAMRGAIARMRTAARLCDRAQEPPGGAGAGAPPAVTPAPGPAPAPAPAPPLTITLHVAAGPTLAYTETSAVATAGPVRIVLANGSSLSHFVAVRPGTGQPALAESPLAAPGATTQIDLTLPAGNYQIFCRNNGHDQLGMVIPLAVS